MTKNGWELEIVRMRYHKEEQLDMGEACYVKHCWSTRPAYVLSATKDDCTVDLMYLYEPQGLLKQYYYQSSILARFQDEQLALCFLHVATTELGMQYMQRACTVSVTEAEKKAAQASSPVKDIEEDILKQWHSCFENFQIEACDFSVPTDVGPLPQEITWASMPNLLHSVANSIYHRYRNWMQAQEETEI